MEFALLAGLSEGDRRQVLMAARRRRFGRREVIFHEGDPGEALHLVDSGHVALRVTTPAGDVGLVRIVAAGDFFGELALLSDGPRSATALAIETVETLSITRADFAALRTRTIATGDFVANALAVEVRRLSAAHVEAMFLTVDKRVYRRLASAARLFGSSPPIPVPLTQDEVAQLAGTTRPTVNRLLVDAQEANAVKLSRGRIEVLDLAWLDHRGR